ncbi:hypothetical protein F4775DRAFT_569347 [Biscogniauxia sp. FL1348]|nr:hypothetical protein F4775DRAFT_569347 [Biscogniauxia sp. FL1348]
MNAVMGPLESTTSVAHELGILGEVVAPTQETSHAIANNVRTSLLHMPYAGQLATTGNFASPLSPHEQDAGEVFRFSLYHLIDLEPGQETTLFPIRYHLLEGSAAPQPTQRYLTQKELETLASETVQIAQPKQIPDSEIEMMEIASVVRSKNSGPFELTLDIMFDHESSYRRVKAANVLTNEVIKKLYQVQDEDILVNMYYDPAMAWKCTLKRPWAQGSIGERDTLGTQQHAPLLKVIIPAVNTC